MVASLCSTLVNMLVEVLSCSSSWCRSCIRAASCEPLVLAAAVDRTLRITSEAAQLWNRPGRCPVGWGSLGWRRAVRLPGHAPR